MGPKQNKKGGGRSNKKKKGKNKEPRGAARNSAASSPIENIENLPTFHKQNAIDTTSRHVNGGGIYGRYKRATGAFRNWLRTVLPPRVPLETVPDLQRAADLVLESSKAYLSDDATSPIVVPRDAIQNLDESIALRVKVSQTLYGGGDEGHTFMIDTLKYCRRVLGLSRNMMRVAVAPDTTKRAKEGVTEIGGRFNALLLDDDSDEEEDEADQEMIREGRFPVITPPREPQDPAKYTIEDLINGSDRFQACAFISTMNELMGAVDQHYVLLKQTMRGEGQHETSSYLQLLMECAVVANMATESVCCMETQLAADHPHLSSFYNVIAVVFLCPLIVDVDEGIKPSVKDKHPNLAKTFAGDITECAFRNKAEQKMAAKVRRFAKTAGMELASAENFANQIKLAVDIEIQLAANERMNATLNSMAQSAGVKPHMWFERNYYLGGDRCILNTQHLVQAVFDVVQHGNKLMPKPGFFGDMWDEGTHPARRIRGDMDQLFAGDILPELIEMCKRAPIACLPNRQELLPLLDLLATHVRNTNDTVPISLTFGLHTILTSMLVLQGDGDLQRLAGYSKQSYNRLFEQLEKELSSDFPQAPSFYLNVNRFKNLVHLAKPIGKPGSSTSEKNAFWNPVVGGEYLLFASYIVSIGLGSATVDSLGQLRFSLHLYNSLRKSGLVQDISFLSRLDKVFDKTKAIWVGGRPIKGAFAKHFWLAWGMSIKEATERSENARMGKETPVKLGKDMTRELDEVRPEEYSASYRRLVQRDFSDCVDNYSVINTTDKQNKRYKGLFDLISRVNMTRDSMDEDEDSVLPMNFTAVGCLLNEFICGLNKTLGWEPLINASVSTCPDEVRHGVRASGRRARVGGFETSDVNLERQALAVFLGGELSKLDFEEGSGLQSCVKVAAYMTDFFGGIPEDRYTFLVEEDEEPDTTATSGSTCVASGPLSGSYPVGRTGRTVRDPLRAFCHYKYSKVGTPVVRLIKPGKQTPYIMSATPAERRQRDFNESAYVETPYHEAGSKQVRQANGRYRHIASYSLEELVALGWDGAKYLAQGNHDANGLWCPFVCGYDSDPENRYDPIDVAAGKRAGTVGLEPGDVGLYMDVPMKGGNLHGHALVEGLVRRARRRRIGFALWKDGEKARPGVFIATRAARDDAAVFPYPTPSFDPSSILPPAWLPW